MAGKPTSDVEVETRRVVERLYQAYLAGDPDGMLATMSEDVWVRFLGIVELRGLEEARSFFRTNSAKLLDLDFRVEKLIVDGRHAAAVWNETARTADGEPYANHGVDVFQVDDGRVSFVHENNDINVHRRHFGGS